MISVGMDVTPLISGRTGISLYIAELVPALRARGVEVRPFAVGRPVHATSAELTRFRLPARIVHASWSHGGPPRAEHLVGAVDVVHATGLVPPTTRRPIVATVHDLTPLEHPSLHPPRLVKQTEALLAGLVRAQVVLAVSGATARAICERGVPAERIVVVYQGPPGLGPAASSPGVQGPYLLAVGEQIRRKGLATLIEAFARAESSNLRLVHAGPPGPETRRLMELAGRLGVNDRVTMLGFVERPQLAALMRDATALCYPSLAEGFGFPVLEALALGIPVMVSDIPSVREIADDAALLVPPGEVEAWAEAIALVGRDHSVLGTLADRGPARASRFTWAACALGTIEAYERAVHG